MSLRLEIDGATAHMLIDRADKRNAFSRSMWDSVPAILNDVRKRHEIRALVLRSAKPGGVFCAGADIGEMTAYRADPEWSAANQAAINSAQYELARFPVPTLAFVEGDCIGGGCGLAMACDIRIATQAARFGITPARLGLAYPLHDVKLLVDLVGPGQAKRLLFTGSLIGAAEAQRIGLVDILADGVSSILDPILAGSPRSLRTLKAFVRRVQDGQTEDDKETLKAFAGAFAAADFAEGTAAFLEKRKPAFGD